MKTKHTPGPWTAKANLDVVDSNGERVARLASTRGKYEYEEINARLIAAAPELLDALQELVNGPECGGDHGAMYRNARAAIAKATGGGV
jgi:hypothetical protein